MASKSTSKPWRLPKNWADRMTLDDARDTLAHWQSRVAFWDHRVTLGDSSAPRHARICRNRVSLWNACIARKLAGQTCQDLVAAAVAKGDEPIDLSVPHSTPETPIKTGAKAKRKSDLSVPYSGPSLF